MSATALKAIRWNIGPDDAECEAVVEIERCEPMVRLYRDGSGYPGSAPAGWIDSARITENGVSRQPTAAEWDMIEADEDELVERVLHDDN